jgi:hypothetical protein
VIDNRILWKEDKDKPRTLFGDRYDVFAYNEQGRVYCSCPATVEQRELSFCGFEKDRNTLKYRCPAAANGFVCQGREKCECCAPDGVNSRIDRVLGFEQHFIRGMAKMEMRVSLALVIMLAMAKGRILSNQADLMRSMTAPVRITGS